MVKAAPTAPATEILSVSIPSPPLIESPGWAVVPVAPFACNTPLKMSLPFVPDEASVPVVSVLVSNM